MLARVRNRRVRARATERNENEASTRIGGEGDECGAERRHSCGGAQKARSRRARSRTASPAASDEAAENRRRDRRGARRRRVVLQAPVDQALQAISRSPRPAAAAHRTLPRGMSSLPRSKSSPKRGSNVNPTRPMLGKGGITFNASMDPKRELNGCTPPPQAFVLQAKGVGEGIRPFRSSGVGPGLEPERAQPRVSPRALRRLRSSAREARRRIAMEQILRSLPLIALAFLTRCEIDDSSNDDQMGGTSSGGAAGSNAAGSGAQSGSAGTGGGAGSGSGGACAAESGDGVCNTCLKSQCCTVWPACEADSFCAACSACLDQENDLWDVSHYDATDLRQRGDAHVRPARLRARALRGRMWPRLTM